LTIVPVGTFLTLKPTTALVVCTGFWVVGGFGVVAGVWTTDLAAGFSFCADEVAVDSWCVSATGVIAPTSVVKMGGDAKYPCLIIKYPTPVAAAIRMRTMTRNDPNPELPCIERL